jgi:hypothetical protein
MFSFSADSAKPRKYNFLFKPVLAADRLMADIRNHGSRCCQKRRPSDETCCQWNVNVANVDETVTM